jgi:hypothetical protein
MGSPEVWVLKLCLPVPAERQSATQLVSGSTLLPVWLLLSDDDMTAQQADVKVASPQDGLLPEVVRLRYAAVGHCAAAAGGSPAAVCALHTLLLARYRNRLHQLPASN